MNSLQNRKVLVTGATGFVGCRLVEKLILYHGAQVRVLVRKLGHVTRLARFPLEICRGEVNQDEAVDAAVAGCDTVFHCAHDWYDKQVNLDGARALAGACLKHGVRRLVYVSSMAVYGWPEGDVDESAAARVENEYARNKHDIEEMLLAERRDRNLPVVILQPSCVYGPFSQPWTVEQTARMRLGRVVLPDDGQGMANCVYVDDLADALALAATRDGVVGERFLISSDRPVHWRDFFGAYEKMLGTHSITFLPTEQIREMIDPKPSVSNFRLMVLDPRRLLNWAPLKKMYRALRRRVRRDLLEKAKKSVPPPVFLPSPEFLEVYRCRTRARIDKARDRLGYRPQFDLERGMAVTAEFVKRTTV